MDRNEERAKCAIDYEWKHQDEMTDPSDSFMLRDAYSKGWRDADNNPVNPWISVEDRLPQKIRDGLPFSKTVLIHTNKGFYSGVYYHDDKKWSIVEGLNFGLTVTHWMPIPELPNKEA